MADSVAPRRHLLLGVAMLAVLCCMSLELARRGNQQRAVQLLVVPGGLDASDNAGFMSVVEQCGGVPCSYSSPEVIAGQVQRLQEDIRRQ